MTSNDEMIGEIVDANIARLWDLYSMHYTDDDDIDKKSYERVMLGDEIVFHIKDYIMIEEGRDHDSSITLDYKNRKASVRTDKGIYNYHMWDFWEEIDTRKAIMRAWLLEYYSSKEYTAPAQEIG